MLIKLAGIQISCCEEKERNIEKAVKFAQIAIEKGANLICFQELFTTHWFPREMNKRYFPLAEKIDGLTITRMQRLAEENKVVLICPIFEIEEDSFYNSAIVIDADGKILGSYRKIHVPQIPLWEERYYFSSGNHGFPVFKTKFARHWCSDLLGQFLSGRIKNIGAEGSQDSIFSYGRRFCFAKKMGNGDLEQCRCQWGLYFQGESGRERSETRFLWEVFLYLSRRRIIG